MVGVEPLADRLVGWTTRSSGRAVSIGLAHPEETGLLSGPPAGRERVLVVTAARECVTLAGGATSPK
jgi:hypothetical protein